MPVFDISKQEKRLLFTIHVRQVRGEQAGGLARGWRVQLVTIKAGSAAICWQPNHLQGFIPIQ